MTEGLPSAIGTVAQEAARLIEDMAAMARSERSRNPRPYAGQPAHEHGSPDAQHARSDAPQARPDAQYAPPGAPRHAPPPDEDPTPVEEPAATTSGICSVCGGLKDGTPVACSLCPICQGIALMRSVRPETVDLLADLALAVAATLRDVATRSRASDGAPSARPASGSPPYGGRPDARPGGARPDGARPDRAHPDGGRASVQDIPVDDDSEG